MSLFRAKCNEWKREKRITVNEYRKRKKKKKLLR